MVSAHSRADRDDVESASETNRVVTVLPRLHRAPVLLLACRWLPEPLPAGIMPLPSKPVKTIVLISCGKKKLGYRANAESLYCGDLFQKSLAYAQQIREATIFILSAEHKLVKPDEQIDPYNVTLNNMPQAEVKAWSDIVFCELKKCADVKNDHFVFLAGDRYRRYLVPRLCSVEVPMKGLKIGEQLQFLKRHLG